MKQRILKRKLISAELKKIFDYRLTVVVAAMGYGKTTSVKTFLYEAEADYVWLSVDSDEASPQYIWDCLTRQLAKVKPDLGDRLNALGFPIDAPQRDRVVGAIVEYAFSTNTVLVIDDYHLARSPELDRLLERIVRSDISGLHIVLISRTKPELNTEELQLKGYCCLFESDLFELSKQEIKEYFKLFGKDISDDTSGQVHGISEGWITAVYLMIQRYCETGKLEMGKNIEVLIEKAIMSRYTPEEAKLLIALCILNYFTPEQAVYVTGNPAAAGTIQRLCLDNSLIRYDQRTETYKIHHIFSGYLQKLLKERFSGTELQKLFRRAGEWHIQNGDVLSGLMAFLKAKEYDLILTEFEKPGITKIVDRYPQSIVKLFEQIPPAVKYRHPLGYLLYADFYLSNIDMEDGTELLAQIEKYYRDDLATPPDLKNRIFGEIELSRTFVYFNDLRKMHECQLKAYQLLDGGSSIANKDMIFTFGSPHLLYLYYRDRGELRWIADYADQVFHYYSEVSHGCGTGFEYLVNAEYYLETGDFAEAETYAQKTIYKAQTMAQVSIIICANLTLARLYAAQGRFAEVVELINDLYAGVDEENSPVLYGAVDLLSGYVGAVLGEPGLIPGWLKTGDMEQSRILYQGLGFNYIVHAKALLLEGNYLKLEVLCEEMQQIFTQFNNLFGFLHVHIMNAAVQYKLYGMEKAQNALETALEIGRADGIILPFAEYGVYILDILKALKNDSGNDTYLDKLIKEASRYCSNLELLAGEKTAAGELTEREREILRLVGEGQSNREIAAGLYLAEITVKKNISSIYRKLGVEGRAAAVKKALELKLI
ncbi:MAG TPA: LuxR C-terminal-related transcriptional regulator [Bacillota bacterium]